MTRWRKIISPPLGRTLKHEEKRVSLLRQRSRCIMRRAVWSRLNAFKLMRKLMN